MVNQRKLPPDLPDVAEAVSLAASAFTTLASRVRWGTPNDKDGTIAAVRERTREILTCLVDVVDAYESNQPIADRDDREAA